MINAIKRLRNPHKLRQPPISLGKQREADGKCSGNCSRSRQVTITITITRCHQTVQMKLGVVQEPHTKFPSQRTPRTQTFFRRWGVKSVNLYDTQKMFELSKYQNRTRLSATEKSEKHGYRNKTNTAWKTNVNARGELKRGVLTDLEYDDISKRLSYKLLLFRYK